MKSQKSLLNNEKQVQCKDLFSVENASSRVSYTLSRVPGSRTPLGWLSERDSREGTTTM